MSDFELVIETDTRGFQPVELRVESLLYDRVELSDELKACFTLRSESVTVCLLVSVTYFFKRAAVISKTAIHPTLADG